MNRAKSFLQEKIKNFNISRFLTNWGSVIALIVVTIFFAIRLKGLFLSPSNITTILRSISITTVIAIGITITVAVGGFDLSSGAMASGAGVLVISFMIWYEMNMFQSISLTLIIAALFTLPIMLLIIVFKVPDLLATLAMMFLLDGIALTYSGGGSLSQGWPKPDGSPSLGIISDTFKEMGQAPTIIIIMLIVILLAHIFLTYTKYGRFIYATGENKEAARLSGIPVKWYRLIAGMLSTLFIVIGGLLVASRNVSAQIKGASGFLMPAISAVFIGNSIAGAKKPNAIGTFLGAALVGILENGLVMMSIPYYSLEAIKGLVLAIALATAYSTSKE